MQLYILHTNHHIEPARTYLRRVILGEIKRPKNESPTQSINPMRAHDPEYYPSVALGSRVKGCTNFGLKLCVFR